jgi:hypothetical protein
MAQYSRWVDKSTGGHGLARSNAIIHGSLQIGPGGYASDGTSQIAAAEIPSGTARLYSTANGVFAVAISGADLLIYKSTDGLAAYNLKATLATANTASLLPLLVDCGSNRLVLGEYATTAPNQWNPRLWGSSDGGENWAELFTCTTDAIRHFHGGVYDTTTDTLYLLTGDDAHRNSIVFCDDVADLFANPNTWKGRWGLDNATRATIDTDYIVGYNSVTYRVVNTSFFGDYMYWGEDTYGVPGGVSLHKMNRTTRAVTPAYTRYHSDRIWEGKAFQEMWMAGNDNTGAPILSAHGRTEATYLGDTKAHVYRLDHFGMFEEILSIPMEGGQYPVLYDIHTIAGKTVIVPASGTFTPLVGEVIPQKRTRSQMLTTTLAPGQVARPRQLLVMQQDGWPALNEDGTFIPLESADYVTDESGTVVTDEAGEAIFLELE